MKKAVLFLLLSVSFLSLSSFGLVDDPKIVKYSDKSTLKISTKSNLELSKIKVVNAETIEISENPVDVEEKSVISYVLNILSFVIDVFNKLIS
jgi:hypothetical protein